jgi:hypothetical protein
MSGQRHSPVALPPEEESPDAHCIGGYVGPRAGQERKLSSLGQGWKPGFPARIPSLYRLSNIVPLCN